MFSPLRQNLEPGISGRGEGNDGAKKRKVETGVVANFRGPRS